jgi:hypothetical protein
VIRAHGRYLHQLRQSRSALALKLAAMLEAEGWKVWWDTSLIPGDDFRNEMRGLLFGV